MILFDATPLQSEHRLRGLGTYTLNIALNLLDICSESIAFAAAAGDFDRLPEAVRRRAVVERRGHRPAQVYWLYNEWFLRRVTRQVRPSVIHATDFNGLIVPRGIPTIATLHDVTVYKEGFNHSDLSGRLSDLRWKIYFHRKLPRATHIIAISDAVKADAIHLLGIPEHRISVVPHGIDVEIFRPDSGPKPTNDPYLLFVGGRNANKNLSRVLDAFTVVKDEFPGMSLRIAGGWSVHDLEWLREQTYLRDIEQRVQHIGYVTQEELVTAYSHAEAFLFPSLEEGFGLPILEAMACGSPVITSNRGAMREVAGNAAQLIDPEDTEEIVTAIRDVLLKPRLKDELIQLGRTRASEFSWKSAARKTFEVYQEFYTPPYR